jgi:large subunit ribosomal protein L29
MKVEEMQSMSDAQLRQKLEEDREELFNLRFQIETRKTKNHQRIPAVKRDIARTLTVLRERELMRQYGGEDVELEVDQQPDGTRQAATEETPRRRLFGRNRQK